MKYLVQKDRVRRVRYSKIESFYLIWKTAISNCYWPVEMRSELSSGLHRILQKNTVVRIKNRCSETGRSHSVYRFCHLSRIKLREWAAEGKLLGVRNSSW